MMQVIIPVAGYGTRLYPLTEDKPKALLEVKGKPILEHIVRKIEELRDVNGVFIVSNAKFYRHFKQWAQGFSSTIPIKVLNDGTTSNENRKGQVGDIQFVIEQEEIDDDLLVVAGDNLFNFSLVPAHDFFKRNKAIVNGLWDSKSLEVAKQQGVAAIDNSKKIVLFQEKEKNPKSTLISLGIYLFPKDKVKLFKRFIEEGNDPDKMGYFIIWLIENGTVYGHIYYKKWFDIGWPSALKKARKEFVP